MVESVLKTLDSPLNQRRVRYFRPQCPYCHFDLSGLHWKQCAQHAASCGPTTYKTVLENIAQCLYKDVSDYVRLKNWPIFYPGTYKENPSSQEDEFLFRCPLMHCRQVFKGKGFDGIDAHWKSKHESACPYDIARVLIVPVSKSIRLYLTERRAIENEYWSTDKPPSEESGGAAELDALVQQLYAIVSALEEKFPGRKFTPDGHLVGSIGEVIGASHYGLDLLPASHPIHDAVDPAGRFTQIKITQSDKSVSLYAKPDRLLVLRLYKDGTWDEIYFGEGEIVWDQCGSVQKNGQRQISVNALRKLGGE